MIRRVGISFEVKLLDFFDLGKPTRSKIHKDVLNLVQVFHEIVGGKESYARQPKAVKDIIRGQKDTLILALSKCRRHPAVSGEPPVAVSRVR